MRVQQAKDIARQWVQEKGAELPGFAGAFFHGSINWLADDADLPASSDEPGACHAAPCRPHRSLRCRRSGTPNAVSVRRRHQRVGPPCRHRRKPGDDRAEQSPRGRVLDACHLFPLSVGAWVLAQDSPIETQERFSIGYRRLLADLSITSFADLQRRCAQVRESLPAIRAVAEIILAANPEIEAKDFPTLQCPSQ